MLPAERPGGLGLETFGQKKKPADRFIDAANKTVTADMEQTVNQKVTVDAHELQQSVYVSCG